MRCSAEWKWVPLNKFDFCGRTIVFLRYLNTETWRTLLPMSWLSWMEVWVDLEQVLVWGFSFSAAVRHCPWCADWPRASHFSPSRFCLLRDTELWWMVIVSSPCEEIVGKEITSSDHFHPSASAVLCLPDFLSSSGYHASSVFETCQNILFLKKDTFGMSIIGIYIVLGPRGVWHNSFTLNTAISLQKPTKSHRPSDNNCFTFLNLPVIWGMSELRSWELLLSTIYWGLFFNTRIYYNFF